MLGNGWIKVHRSLLQWEWYDDINTKVIFLHLLLTVSIKDSRWHGIEIKRGSRVASFAKLAEETGLTVDKVRTAIAHLESTGEITRSKHAKFTVFALNHYDKFQEVPSKIPESSQGHPKVNPSSSQGNPNSIRIKEDKEDIRMQEERVGAARPPTLEEVQAYCQQRQNGIDPVRFYDFYAATGWKKHGQPIEDWKALLRTWETNAYARQTVPADANPDDDDMDEYLSLVNRFMEDDAE